MSKKRKNVPPEGNEQTTLDQQADLLNQLLSDPKVIEEALAKYPELSSKLQLAETQEDTGQMVSEQIKAVMPEEPTEELTEGPKQQIGLTVDQIAELDTELSELEISLLSSDARKAYQKRLEYLEREASKTEFREKYKICSSLTDEDLYERYGLLLFASNDRRNNELTSDYINHYIFEGESDSIEGLIHDDEITTVNPELSLVNLMKALDKHIEGMKERLGTIGKRASKFANYLHNSDSNALGKYVENLAKLKKEEADINKKMTRWYRNKSTKDIYQDELESKRRSFRYNFEGPLLDELTESDPSNRKDSEDRDQLQQAIHEMEPDTFADSLKEEIKKKLTKELEDLKAKTMKMLNFYDRWKKLIEIIVREYNITFKTHSFGPKLEVEVPHHSLYSDCNEPAHKAEMLIRTLG